MRSCSPALPPPPCHDVTNARWGLHRQDKVHFCDKYNNKYPRHAQAVAVVHQAGQNASKFIPANYCRRWGAEAKGDEDEDWL